MTKEDEYRRKSRRKNRRGGTGRGGEMEKQLKC
jgi:hypothetical protein